MCAVLGNLLALFLSAQMFVALPYSAREPDENEVAMNTALRRVLRQYLVDQEVENKTSVRYNVALVDLNEDGVEEVVVHLVGQGICGTGGCPTLVLVPVGSSFKIVSRTLLTRPPIRVLNRKSNGWH